MGIAPSFIRKIYIFFGFICLFLAIIGIFIPLLPTTPFLLLTAYLFSKGSKTLENKLLSNSYFGKYIANYKQGKGIPTKVKVIALIFLWSTILCSAILFISSLYIQILLLILAIGISIHILLIRKSKEY